jgi:hypothetical protein
MKLAIAALMIGMAGCAKPSPEPLRSFQLAQIQRMRAPVRDDVVGAPCDASPVFGPCEITYVVYLKDINGNEHPLSVEDGSSKTDCAAPPNDPTKPCHAPVEKLLRKPKL